MTVNPMYMEKVGRQIKERGTVSRKHINGVYRVAYQRVMKDGFDSKLTNSEALHLGKFGVDACYQAGIIQQVRTTGSKGMMVYYELHPEVSKFLTGYTLQDVRAVINVEAGAMTCVPDPWTNLNDGGYLSVRRKANAPLLSLRNVRKEERARLRNLFTAECLPTIFRVANYLQEQSFSVHLPTLEAIQRVWYRLQSSLRSLSAPYRTVG
jgi:DNA-directed RNA polymerase